MANSASDEVLIPALDGFVRAAEQVIKDPRRWLGTLDDGEKETASFRRKSLNVTRKKVFGELNPASPEWNSQSSNARVNWWVQRIGVLAGLAGAATRVSGSLTARLQMQAALGAASSSLLVCAVAHEHGRHDRNEWIPIIAKVVFGREIAIDIRPISTGVDATNEPGPDVVESQALQSAPSVNQSGFGDRLNQGVRLLWGLAAAFKNPEDLFDKRPRGSAMSQTVGKVPGVGTIGGWFDERGALKKAAEHTQAILEKCSCVS
jgi:hypothetical protein